MCKRQQQAAHLGLLQLLGQSLLLLLLSFQLSFPLPDQLILLLFYFGLFPPQCLNDSVAAVPLFL